LANLLTPARKFGLTLAVLVFGLDRFIKWLMISPLDLQNVRVIELIPFFDLRWTENYGVSLGFLQAETPAMRWGLVALTAAIAITVLVWLLREVKRADILPLGLVLGGALGNIWDRVAYGYVVDYADLHFGEFRPFLIFNLADAAITIGVLLILARSFLVREKRADTTAGAPATESEHA
jgi:signal peptidase II